MAANPRFWVIGLGNPPREVFGPVAEALCSVYGGAFLGSECAALPPWAYVPERRQYDSSEILTQLRGTARDCDFALGITDADLCVHVFSFVFGEADLPGRAAVISTHRLRPSFYGLPEGQQAIADRAAKEAVHEIGHAFGLLHCRNAACAMFPSDSVEATDVKNARPCARCAAELARLKRERFP